MGVGFAFNAEHTPEGWRVVLIATTPVDDDRTEIFGTYWLEDVPGGTARTARDCWISSSQRFHRTS